MKTNPFWATDEFAREVAKRKIWSRKSWANRKVHAFLRLAQPTDLSPDAGDYSDFSAEIARGECLVSACYAKIKNRLSSWGHRQYFLKTSTANDLYSPFRLLTVRADNPWEIDDMCFGCRRAIGMGEGVGFGVCSDYD